MPFTPLIFADDAFRHWALSRLAFDYILLRHCRHYAFAIIFRHWYFHYHCHFLHFADIEPPLLISPFRHFLDTPPAADYWFLHCFSLLMPLRQRPFSFSCQRHSLRRFCRVLAWCCWCRRQIFADYASPLSFAITPIAAAFHYWCHFRWLFTPRWRHWLAATPPRRISPLRHFHWLPHASWLRHYALIFFFHWFAILFIITLFASAAISIFADIFAAPCAAAAFDFSLSRAAAASIRHYFSIRHLRRHCRHFRFADWYFTSAITFSPFSLIILFR